MFALENVKKFLKDREAEIPAEERQRILKGCEEWTRDGVMTGGVPERVMPPAIAKQFLADFEANPEHVEIAYKAVTKEASKLET